VIVNKKHRVLVLHLRDPSAVTNIIPHAKAMPYKGNVLTVVPHRMTEYRLLKNLGLNPPHPIDHYYNWPGQYQPLDAQRETVRFLTSHQRAYCLNDLGTGKTLSSLWAFDFLQQQDEVHKMLVVAPLSTLERTWGDELFNHFPHLRFNVLHGTAAKRRILLAEKNVDVYIINHDGVKVLENDLQQRPDIDLVIIDELAQVARNAQTDRWKSLRTLLGIRKWTWGMTGTPTPNAPTDAWAQARLITPSTVPTFFAHFRDATMRQMATYTWVARDEANDVVHRAMQPAIRFKRDDCVDLPPVTYETREVALTKDQQAVYNSMLARLYAEYQGGEITAVNEAVKTMKLVQIACIAYNTPVLTRTGWKAIQLVTDEDEVWDGEDWVQQDGAALMGLKPTVQCYGTHMTLDHRVLTATGWQSAEEVLNAPSSQRPNRATVRIPDGYLPRRVNDRQDQVCDVAMPVRLWKPSRPCKPVPSATGASAPTELRVPSRQRDAQDVSVTGVQQLLQHAAQVLRTKRQGLSELRRAWDNRVRTVAGVVREFLGGHGADAPAWAVPGSGGQQRPLLTGELPVDHTLGASKQSAHQQGRGHTERENELGGRCQSRWDDSGYGVQPGIHTEVAFGSSPSDPRAVVPVYDLINCGPRNRFTVLGDDGVPLVVHNCGAAYDADGNTIYIPPKARIQALLEVIEEAASKVIVFVPFKSALKALHEQVSRHHSAEMIYGEVSKPDRDRILGDFQHGANPKVLIAQPAAMSHGLTLTAASVICWFAPITSAETYEQANARITRPGQKLNQLIIHIQGTALENRMFNRLRKKVAMQGMLLDMFREGVTT
jgi:superfamily II DNA or RNA helicase